MGTLPSTVEMEVVWKNPFFWASLGLFGWILVPPVVASRELGRHPALGYLCTVFLVVPTFVLPLSFVDQPRFASPLWQTAGILLVLIGLVFFVATFFQVRAFTRPQRTEPLRTRGYYAIVRHPMTLGGVLAALGWALNHGSPIGVSLAVVYGLCGWLGTFLEEERLVEEYGEAYRRYQGTVPRLFPIPRPRRKP
jgi:protein-S-isoprenylcysteine O-methyltransferase Ste14